MEKQDSVMLNFIQFVALCPTGDEEDKWSEELYTIILGDNTECAFPNVDIAFRIF